MKSVGNGRALKRKLKISNEEFKEYLLDKYVDSNGDKVSVRAVWNDQDFMSYTGMFKINEYTGGQERVSEGTISYYNKKLGLQEKDIFDYHKNISKRIPATLSFEEWSRKNNKGYTREEILNQETIKRRMIKYFGLTETYVHFSFSKVRELTERICGKEELTKFYTEVMTNG